jgi:ribA/ribD-fused uncharacterized protein
MQLDPQTRPSGDGVPTMSNLIREFKGEYRFLSNFWYVDVEYKGVKYPSTEHAYQAQKCISPLDKALVLKCDTPAQAKALGRDVPAVPDWDNIKLDIMKDLLLIKFNQPDLKRMLLATGDAVLQEGNYWGDAYWGVKLTDGSGENHLGKLLMEVREHYKHEP